MGQERQVRRTCDADGRSSRVECRHVEWSNVSWSLWNVLRPSLVRYTGLELWKNVDRQIRTREGPEDAQRNRASCKADGRRGSMNKTKCSWYTKRVEEGEEEGSKEATRALLIATNRRMQVGDVRCVGSLKLGFPLTFVSLMVVYLGCRGCYGTVAGGSYQDYRATGLHTLLRTSVHTTGKPCVACCQVNGDILMWWVAVSPSTV